MGNIPKEFIDTLILREEPRDTVYKDTSGYLTGGTGHRLVGEELKIYEEGDVIPKSVSKKWFKDDSEKAYKNAKIQIESLGMSGEKITNAFGHLNFQLGENWMKKGINKFPDAWKSLQKGDYVGAARHFIWKSDLSAKSDWYDETPDRVKDLARELIIYNVSLKPEDKLINKMKEKDNILNYAD
jgi:hypothetical protein